MFVFVMFRVAARVNWKSPVDLNIFHKFNRIQSMSQQQKFGAKIEAALIDLSGTLHVEDEAIGNAVPALAR